MKTHEADTSNFVGRNIDMGFEFIKRTVDDHALLEGIPNGAAVIHVPDDDPELAEHNLEIALETVRRGYDVYIRHMTRNSTSS